MDYFKLIQTRQSVRDFQNKKVEQEKIDQISQAILQAPSSRGIYPCEFIFVQNKELVNQLSEAKEHGSAFLKNAPLALAVIADPNKADVWVEDASIACTYAMLAAVELGLATCWIQIRKRENKQKASDQFVKEVLNIPKYFQVEAIIAIGYPKDIKSKERQLDVNKIFNERYGK